MLILSHNGQNLELPPESLIVVYDVTEDQYEKLTDAVYFRQGWTPNGVPTPKKMKELGFLDKKMLEMLQSKILEDEKAGLNIWKGKYDKNEKIPNDGKKYW